MQQPFAGIGMSNIRLSLGEIFNFSVSVAALDPAPGDLVLDLGAGACWVSDWLNRLLVNTVSLDIAADMLLTGQQRMEKGAKLTVGDFESLPFADGAFDGAICISALHHVPDIPRTLREIRRVLKKDASAVFSEPGLGHASHAQSRTEMEELGVLERDIVVSELLDECLKAGFEHVSVHPYLFPPPSYDYGLWRFVQQATQSQRLFSLRTLWHTILEMTLPGSPRGREACERLVSTFPVLGRLHTKSGARSSRQREGTSSAKQEHGSEAMLCWQSLLTLRRAVEAHPVVLARKGWPQPDSRRPGQLKAQISIMQSSSQVAPGAPFTVQAMVENTGDTLWLAKPTRFGGFVTLGAKLLDTNNLLISQDYGRAQIGQDVAPGEAVTIELSLRAPLESGRYRVKLDMVDECVAWFEHTGSEAVIVPLEVGLPA
jgi:ubiquinone/menaquinone biosynthesis C-methylase UbiE